MTDNETDTIDSSTWDIAYLFVENETDYDPWSVNTENYEYEGNIEYRSLEDGEFKICLGSVWGDFTINRSILTIEDGVSSAAPVPEPATMLLMGTGLIGMVAGRKKLFKK